MAEAGDYQVVRHGGLSKPRLYTGDADCVLEGHELPQGSIAAASIGDASKPGPNEDSAAIIPVGDHHLVLIVADGVGGLHGARQASNQTVKAVRDALRKSEANGERNLRHAIMDGIETANRLVLENTNGSASTLALAEIGPDYCRSYHVGDSIVLLCGQRGRLKGQTTPHSPVGFAVEAGLMDEQEALHHDQRNLIFNVIGSADMSIEVGSEQAMAARDTLLLASDGLTDNLMQEEIISAVRAGPITDALTNLTRQAQQRMLIEQPGQPNKPDDFTVLLYRRPPPKRR